MATAVELKAFFSFMQSHTAYHSTIIMNHTIVLHSGNDEGVGVVHEIVLPKNQPQFAQTMMGQYWLSNSAFTLAAGHGMVQYVTVWHAYFL